MSSSRLSYRFGPLERRGLFGALRGGQLLIMALTATAALVLLNSRPTAAVAMLVLLLTTGGLALTVVPLGRRAADEWLPVLAAYIARGLTGRRIFRSPRPRTGIRTGSSRAEASLPPLRLPGTLRGSRSPSGLPRADDRRRSPSAAGAASPQFSPAAWLPSRCLTQRPRSGASRAGDSSSLVPPARRSAV